MLLQSITLNNVRSYKEQTIHFQEGITLLAGDIGSGKSTILHSIEFALFGASRPDLPAEGLLRKGESKASVTLQLTINNQQIIIHRTLQNTPQGVRQGTGYIIQNNQKFELTAVELKAKMIELLGYPPELITKGKNYVFRYTIYCPQEEMKLILQESAENRLDILRKIFHVEKYKLVRENITLYLRTLRKEITILQTRCEQLPIKEAELLVAQDTVAVNKQELFLIEQKKVQLQTVFTDQQQLVEAIKQSVKEHQILQQEYFAIERSQLDLSEHQNKLAAKITNIISQRTSVTDILNRLHSAAALELFPGYHVVDKYPGCRVGDFAEIKAESKWLEVAAASVIARAAAVMQINMLSKKAGFTIPKGSTHVAWALQELKDRGLDPNEFVKLHFKNVQEFLKN